MIVSFLARGAAAVAAAALLTASPAQAQQEEAAAEEPEDDFESEAPAESAAELSVDLAPAPLEAVVEPPQAYAAALVVAPPSCQPAPSPCVRILGLPGQQFYIVHKDRFRYWATNGYKTSYNATRGIERMLRLDTDRRTVSSEGHFVTQLPRRDQPYLIIPWCARDDGTREVYKASWQTRTEILMRDDSVQENRAECQ